jgi:hypothetical protein
MAFDDATRGRLQKFVGEARALLTDESKFINRLANRNRTKRGPGSTCWAMFADPCRLGGKPPSRLAPLPMRRDPPALQPLARVSQSCPKRSRLEPCALSQASAPAVSAVKRATVAQNLAEWFICKRCAASCAAR